MTNEAGSPEEVVATIAAWLDVTRQAVGPLTHIIMCIPFGGFGGPSMPPYGVHAAALAGYRAKPPGSSDSRTHLIDLGPAAALHLLGFDFNDEATRPRAHTTPVGLVLSLFISLSLSFRG